MSSHSHHQHDDTTAREIANFNKLAHEWWSLDGPLKPLHDINPLRLAWIRQQQPLAGKSVLDIGCGGGILAESMARCGAKVTAIDLASSLIDVAKAHAQQSGLSIDYHCCDAATWLKNKADITGSFDVITCMELLEHVDQPQQLLDTCQKLLDIDGHLFVSTINRNWQSYLFAIIGAEYILKLLPKGTHHYHQFIRPSELSAWANAVNLKIIAAKGLTYNPLNKHYALSSSLKVNYMACLRHNIS